MEILKADRENILLAASVIKKGGLVVYPTDTVYGLGCDPFNTIATKKIFNIKERRNKPLPVLASSIQSIERIGCLSREAKMIAANLWPGPFTLIIQKKSGLPSIVTGDLDSVGVRVPNHNQAIHLITLSNGLLIGTSANKTGKPPPTNATQAADQLGDGVDLILDGGTTPLRISSTVIDLTLKKPRIIRKGSGDPKLIEPFLSKNPSFN